MVDVDHVQPHFLAEYPVVAGQLTHLADEQPGPRPQFLRLVLDIVQVLDVGDQILAAGKVFKRLETFDGGDEDAFPALGKLDPLDDPRDGTRLVEVLRRVGPILGTFILGEQKADIAAVADRLVDDVKVALVGQHQWGEKPREDRIADDREDEEIVGKRLFHWK